MGEATSKFPLHRIFTSEHSSLKLCQLNMIAYAFEMRAEDFKELSILCEIYIPNVKARHVV